MSVSRIVPVLCVGLLLVVGRANAAGFNIYEMSARATALGGAFTATADDPSAIFYNPAGLTAQKSRWSVSLSVSPLLPDARFSRALGSTELAYPGEAQSQTADAAFYPTGLYVGLRHDERLAFGFGFFTPFGLGVEWDNPDEFAGRSLSSNAQLQGFYLSPVVAYAPHEKLSLSVGVHAVKSNLDLEQWGTLVVPDGSGTTTIAHNVIDVELSGTSSWSYGLAAGAMIQAHEKFRIGLNFKQGVENEFDSAEAEFHQALTGLSQIDAAVAAQLAGLGGEGKQGLSGAIDYPSIFVVGGRADLREDFALMADWVWFGWSVFDEVVLDFETAPTQTLVEDYEDAWQFRAGAEYTRDAWRFMAGYVHDQTPQPVESVSPLLPDADRNDYSFGLTWTNPSGNLELTGGYMFVDFDERSTVVNGVGRNHDGFDGSYLTTAHIFTFGATRHF